MKRSATDRAYAQQTTHALSQQKAWRIDRVRGDQQCAERLDMISNDLGGVVLEVIGKSNTWTILWWTWTD